MGGIIFQDGDSLPNGDCTKMCKCDSGMLSECSPRPVYACPPQGCIPEEDIVHVIPGCPPPCPPCPPGRTLSRHLSSFEIIIAFILYLFSS